MEGAAIVTGIPASTGSSMSYNISLNLSSISSFSPSRPLARLRKDVLGQPVDPSDIPATTAADILAQEQPLLQSAPTSPSNVTVYPGPWGFFTSGYVIGFFLIIFRPPSVSKRLSTNRLTTFTSFLCLVHFHRNLFTHYD